MSGTRRQRIGPTDESLLSLGKLQYLATYCPLHSKFPAVLLSRLFIPAIDNGCVRFFETAEGQVGAALIWARLGQDVVERMTLDQVPPRPEDWVSGDQLWFLDLIAPFGQGAQVARHIARNPPDEPFWFARVDHKGRLKRVVSGNAAHPKGQRLSMIRPGVV
ncbi:toxin-activating lysine-acyltransferase [Shimia biformata]|uniref:toxin-activating lysine-acyltransferase n=1 Tax=Shimia biformata TaxID=1294299 RepID=UPI001EF3B4E9|nr:toxin-activating lysine-acyltransferase [Shimia biformata]